jgi:hypothetical protein
LRPYIEWAFRQPGRDGRPISRRDAAAMLNERNIPTTRGGRWNEEQLYRVARRLGMDPPLTARPPRKLTQARVHAIWRQHPEVTARQIKQSLAPDLPVGVQAIARLLKECRLAVAKRSPVQIPKLQYLDSRTALRVRIAAIWKRHPEYTGKQVLTALRTRHSVGVKWVRGVLRQCWDASGKRSWSERHTGRRVYSAWRGCDRRAVQALLSKASSERAERYRALIEWVVRQPGKYGRPISAGYAAVKLNERHIPSPRGRRWHPNTVRSMWKTRRLHHPPVRHRPSWRIMFPTEVGVGRYSVRKRHQTAWPKFGQLRISP